MSGGTYISAGLGYDLKNAAIGNTLAVALQ